MRILASGFGVVGNIQAPGPLKRFTPSGEGNGSEGGQGLAEVVRTVHVRKASRRRRHWDGGGGRAAPTRMGIGLGQGRPEAGAPLGSSQAGGFGQRAGKRSHQHEQAQGPVTRSCS